MTDRPPNQEIVNPDDAPAVAIVTQWYDHIDRGRTGEACRLFRDDIEWFEPEGSPYGAPGSALVGAAAIVSEG